LISELEEIKDIFKEQGRVEEVEAVENKIASLTPEGGTRAEKLEVTEEEVSAPPEQQIPKEVVVEFEQEGIGLLEAVEGKIEEMAEAETEVETEEVAAEGAAESTEQLFDMEDEGGEKEEEPEFLEQAVTTAEEEEPEFIQQAAATIDEEEPEFIQQAAATAEKEEEPEFLRQAGKIG
jgi:hypothetical protein